MAGFKYEKDGILVAVPRGHKKAGWAKPGDPIKPPTKPLVMRGAGGK